jgi:excisionase family DNA binding protein
MGAPRCALATFVSKPMKSLKLGVSVNPIAVPVTALDVAFPPSPNSTPDSHRDNFAFPDRLLTKVEIAKFLGVTTRSVDSWMSNGILPYQKLGRTVRFDLAKVRAYLDEFYTVVRRSSRRSGSTATEGGQL